MQPKKEIAMRGTMIALCAAALLVGCTQPGTPGKTVSPQQAFDMWRANPDKVYVLDVRTPSEYVFIGHAPMARNIPVKFMANQWDAKEKKPAMTTNPDFVAEARKHYKPDDTILVMCGSGKRSPVAVQLLKDAGYKNVLDIEGGFDGMRGSGCADHGSGPLIKPGWKNSGMIWTWAINPDAIYSPGAQVAAQNAAKAGS
jgi:rhodanese-related sulfurtransferase